eukprot:ANDGO_06686.mRNA.1 N-acetyltransferase 9-like protein
MQQEEKLVVITSLSCPNVALVPYMREHVEMYHGWMQMPDNLSMTESEPLTLEEQYAMQKDWLTDEDKLTFIIEISGIPIGDINCFFLDADDEGRLFGEINVMIANPAFRRKGYAESAIWMMMQYVYPRRTTFIAKILCSNISSVSLFREKMGFQQWRHISAFNEVWLLSPAREAWPPRDLRVKSAPREPAIPTMKSPKS